MELFAIFNVSYSENNSMEKKMKKSLLLFTTLLVITGLTLTACAGNASASVVGDWKLVSYGSPTNQTPAVPNVEASVTFGSDGKLNGNVGCNGFSGDYKIDGSTITFGPIMSTLMACTDPIMQQEIIVFSVLTDTATFEIDGTTLTITSADGASAVVFERK
jgi:heat shock protein HslJ